MCYICQLMTMTETAPSPADRFTVALDGMRETIALEGTKKGLAGGLLAAILRLLDELLALLMQFKAGTLVAAAAELRAAPGTDAAGAEAATEPRAPRTPAAAPARQSRDDGAERDVAAGETPAPAALPDAGAKAPPTPVLPRNGAASLLAASLKSHAPRGFLPPSGPSAVHAASGQDVRFGVDSKKPP